MVEACEFWLPPQFLTDEDDLDSSGKGEAKKDGVDSVLSSTESESDEDDSLTALATKLPHSTLQLNNKGLRLSSSPKSPLCKASGRRKMVEESSGLLPTRSEFSVATEQGFPANPHQLSYRNMQFQEFRTLPLMGLPVSAWPPLQRPQQKPQPGTGMRAVFLGNNLGGVKKHCAGTGVFLPRTVSFTGDRENKQGCSTVLIPERVIQALNLNLETLGVQNDTRYHSGYYNNGVSDDNGDGLKFNNGNKRSHVTVQQRQTIPKAEPENQEVTRLPPEWIY